MRFRIALTAAALTVVCGAAAALTHLHGPPDEPSKDRDESSDRADAGAKRDLVKLTDEKLAALDIRVEPAHRRALQDVRVVPGRIEYDETRHVEIRAAANGILTQVRVTLGDPVAAGQVLGLVSSPEIGLARTEVHNTRQRYDLASKKLNWDREVAKNVSAMIEGLKSRVSHELLESRFREKTLGASRDVLMTAYARFVLARNLARTAEKAGAGVLSSMVIEQRLAERRSTEAALSAACEQAQFDVAQRERSAEIEAGDALRRLKIAQQQVTNLLHYSPDTVPTDATDGDLLSRVEIRAPFAGTIEEKRVAQAERVRASDVLFVLADTKDLWVAADVREKDWHALAISIGQELCVDTPALPGCHLKARVRHVGRQVDPKTNSIPLVAQVSNADGLLRPGLFANVSLPIDAPRQVLCVPVAAVVQHEGTKFLFVRESPITFRKVDVTTGMETDTCLEILKGIEEGAPVVVQGGSALKSELLIDQVGKED